MGTKLLETGIICSLDYVPLGLKDPSKDYLGKPHALSLLSTLLERSVQKNERMLETSQSKDVVTIFHGLRAPSLSIQQYIDRIFKYSCCSPSCFIIAHIYLDRFIQRSNFCLTNLNIHRLLITSVMVAAKFMDDKFFNNAYYARVGGVTTAELNKLEMKFLLGVDFRLHVSVQTFKKYCSVLKKEATNGFVEHSIQACDVEESCIKKR
ncbi:cyclin-p3-1 [Phtheirospermum japonicum]|uniref:Cyclin-p3-1 n=1 Tax=Phtheirospermum japonicum TaxID=374723 RepID=A0A830B833_9LAMI|nr:cyclin-p3-1 [Phtheirospermum japonicum]